MLNLAIRHLLVPAMFGHIVATHGLSAPCENMAVQYKEAVCHVDRQSYARHLRIARQAAEECIGYGFFASKACVQLRDAGENAAQAYERGDRLTLRKAWGDIDYFATQCLERPLVKYDRIDGRCSNYVTRAEEAEYVANTRKGIRTDCEKMIHHLRSRWANSSYEEYREHGKAADKLKGHCAVTPNPNVEACRAAATRCDTPLHHEECTSHFHRCLDGQ